MMEPNAIYGISKQANERRCDYYFQKKGSDVRTVGYTALVSYKTPGGGSITDADMRANVTTMETRGVV